MLSFAQNITDITEQLQIINVDQVHGKIKYADENLKQLIRQLRVMKQVDANAYRNQKKRLPYIVCGRFNPSFRRKENFAYTEYFIIDIDHIGEKNVSIESVKNKVVADERVVMCFTSPSEDGLKLMFRLSKRCYDAGEYSLFYKLFLKEFSNQYGLEQVLDSRTSDVTRACFLSYDPNVYYNPNATAVDLSVYVKSDNPVLLYDEKKAIEKKIAEDAVNYEARQADPDAETIEKIKALLNPKATFSSMKQPAYIPAILNDIIEHVKTYIENTGIVVDTISDIQYAKKICCSLGAKRAEINLYFGKRGFNVVKTPKTGTDNELNSMVAELVENCIVLMYGKN
ncbi:MAG: CRISPR-associated primase-polymerase type B [Bacteroidales bacterium]|nr:CRISPR-associated primase-polymerase type B [Bacteroidales bacterium]